MLIVNPSIQSVQTQMTPAQDLRSRRREVDFWGVQGGRGKAGGKKTGSALAQQHQESSSPQMELDNVKGAQACRDL